MINFTTILEDGCGYQPTIDMNNFQIPEDFNLERVVEEVTKVGRCFFGSDEELKKSLCLCVSVCLFVGLFVIFVN